jgi:glycosyltransferase involved in cell wall biosynthesis
MAQVKTAVKVRICGEVPGGVYSKRLLRLASKLGVGDRVSIENRWISEEEKRDIIGRSLAVAYLPLDEDSYGYPTLEAAHSQKPVITTTDAGGVLEFVTHERNGLVCDPDPKAIAEALDRLYSDRELVKALGGKAAETAEKLHINWDNVIDSLLA